MGERSEREHAEQDYEATKDGRAHGDSEQERVCDRTALCRDHKRVSCLACSGSRGGVRIPSARCCFAVRAREAAYSGKRKRCARASMRTISASKWRLRTKVRR
ncbi:MAG: hypothetical protein DHS20C15_14440 [Planctomycetota bacterium]|nr:MAG: hypothetical protein DHS20C15_14440 [Planctomycetota bacterium]